MRLCVTDRQTDRQVINVWHCVLVTLRDPTNHLVLIEGVLFRASYLGSTQLTAQQPGGDMTKAARMIQAHEAVGRIKVTHCTGILSLGKTTSHFQFQFPHFFWCTAVASRSGTSISSTHDRQLSVISSLLY